MSGSVIFRSIAFFLLAALCEIGGGYLIWKVVKENQPLWLGALSAVILVLYGVVATFQPAGFGRAYAAYGGIFVIMALLWGWIIEKNIPDMYDVIGAMIVIAGTMVIFYVPRPAK